MKKRLLILVVTLMMISQAVTAHGTDNKIIRKMLTTSALPNVPEHSLISVTIELLPGISAPSHKHEGFVFAYVISGTVLSQLNQETAVVYNAGDSWVEKPGDQHSVTTNMSDTESVKILAVFVAKNGAKLTTLVDNFQ